MCKIQSGTAVCKGKVQILSNAQWRLSTKLQGATVLWIITWIGHSAVSQFSAVWSMGYVVLVIAACPCTRRNTLNSGNRKRPQGFWNLRPKPLPPPHTIVFPSTHFLLHNPAYSPVLTLIVLVRCQVTKPQTYSLRYSQEQIWYSVLQLTTPVQTEHKSHIAPHEMRVSVFSTWASWVQHMTNEQLYSN